MSQPGFDPAIVVGASEAQATAADPSASSIPSASNAVITRDSFTSILMGSDLATS